MTNEFHRHHARAAERRWADRHFLAGFGHGVAAFGAAPWRGARRFFAGGFHQLVWRVVLHLLTKPTR